jgi:hypothetical protein
VPNGKKYKHLEVMLYVDDGWNIKKIIEEINKRTSVKQYAIMLHDQDISQTTGEPVKPHYHCYLNFGNTSWDFESVAKWFDIKADLVSKIKSNKFFTLKYYTHSDCPEKHQYSVSDFTANFDVAAYLNSTVVKQNEQQLYDEVIKKCANGVITPLNCDELIPDKFFVKYKQRIETAWEFYERKLRKQKRSTKTIYVYGESGVGKTLNCKLYAKAAGLTIYITTPGKNPFDEYRWEQAIILDEVRSGVPFNNTELLLMLDPHNSSMAPARYANKCLHNSHYFMTSVFSPEEFWQGFGLVKQDTAKQFYRRLAEVWHVTETEINIYKYADDKFQLIKTIPNPVPAYLAARQTEIVEIDSCSVFSKIKAEILAEKEEAK